MTFKRRQKEPFTAEEHRFQTSRSLDVVFNALGECDQTTGIDPQSLTPKLLLDHRPTGVNECFTVADQFLEDEAFSSEKTCSKPFLKRD